MRRLAQKTRLPYTKNCLRTAILVCVSVPILSILIVLMFVLIAYLRKYASYLFLCTLIYILFKQCIKLSLKD